MSISNPWNPKKPQLIKNLEIMKCWYQQQFSGHFVLSEHPFHCRICRTLALIEYSNIAIFHFNRNLRTKELYFSAYSQSQVMEQSWKSKQYTWNGHSFFTSLKFYHWRQTDFLQNAYLPLEANWITLVFQHYSMCHILTKVLLISTQTYPEEQDQYNNYGSKKGFRCQHFEKD